MKHRLQKAIAAAILAASMVRAAPALAEGPTRATDGVYGRFDGDLDLSLAAGAAVARSAADIAFTGRVFFLGTTGPYLTYTDPLRESGRSRALTVGVSLRPLFIPRWALDFEHGPATLDLTIDAITLDLGALWTADRSGTFARPPGIELALGTEMPLLGRVDGPWIGARGALRWRDTDLASSAGPRPSGVEPTLLVTLAWHFVANVHLVDAGDRTFR